jgi:ribosomal protein S18 acetylase RimI-like enzyme
VKLIQVSRPDEVAIARQLFEEYAAALGFDLCFQEFDKELAELPGKYSPPSGRLFLASDGNEVAGCIALRKLDDETCEMKRLYVRDAFRGKRAGRKLTEHLINTAREIGYKRMRLDTVPGKMDAAISLYRSLGFEEIEPYYVNPVAGALFFELKL